MRDLTPPPRYGASSHGAGSSARNSSIRLPSLVRKGAGVQVMAVLRNLVIYLCSFVDKPSLAAATRHFLCHPETSMELVSTPI